MSTQTKHTHVKVARCMLTPHGKEIILSLDQGGEAQLWEIKEWERYQTTLQQYPQLRGTDHYPWTYVEHIALTNHDINGITIKPEKTDGKEFQINTNAK